MLSPLHRVTQDKVRLSGARPISLVEIGSLGGDVSPHDHDYFEFTIVVAGKAWHVRDEGEWRLKRGSVLVLAPDEVHGYRIDRSSNPPRLWNIYYLAEWLLADLPLLWSEPHLVDLFLARQLFPRRKRARIPEFDLTEAELRLALAELEELREELKRERPSLIYLKSAFLKFLIQLARAYARVAAEGERLVFREEVWSLLRRVDELVKSGAPFEFALEARELGLTRDHCGRLFREATGASPMEYFQERRIQEACVRLLDPEQQLTTIAFDLGFADSAHFSRFFRKHRGRSPREYRRQFLGCS